MLQGSALTQRLPNARDLPINSPLYKLHPEVMGLYRSAMPNRPARLRWNRRAMVVRRGDTRRASVKLHITRKLDDSVECRFHHSRQFYVRQWKSICSGRKTMSSIYSMDACWLGAEWRRRARPNSVRASHWITMSPWLSRQWSECLHYIHYREGLITSRSRW